MKVLHIIKSLEDKKPLEIAKLQSKEHEVGILFIQDAVLGNLELDFARVYVSDADVKARNLEVKDTVDYERIVGLIFEYESVTSW